MISAPLHREEARLLALVGRTVPLQGRQPGAHHADESRPQPFAPGSIDLTVQGQHDVDTRAFPGVPGSGPGNGLIIGQTHQQDLGLLAGPTVEVLGEPPRGSRSALQRCTSPLPLPRIGPQMYVAGFLVTRPWQGQDLSYEPVEVGRLDG